jgi:hypothetical protein
VLGSLLCEGNVEVMGLWSWGLSHKANSVGKASWPRHRAALQSRRAAVWQRLEGANRWGSIVSGQTCGTDGRKASDKCGRLMRESWETDEWARPKGKFKI